MDEGREKKRAALFEVATKIGSLLSEVILLQQDHVGLVCSGCESPCCDKVQHLFDEKDMIFAEVFLGRSVQRRNRKRNGGCLYLSPTGCILMPRARPFACHRYLCSKLEEEMAGQELGLPQILRQKLGTLERLRGQLWKEYLQTRLPAERPPDD